MTFEVRPYISKIMDEYPDPDEEFELMYGDELNAIKEHEGSILYVVKQVVLQESFF